MPTKQELLRQTTNSRYRTPDGKPALVLLATHVPLSARWVLDDLKWLLRKSVERMTLEALQDYAVKHNYPWPDEEVCKAKGFPSQYIVEDYQEGELKRKPR